jgi:hypothetical protein
VADLFLTGTCIQSASQEQRESLSENFVVKLRRQDLLKPAILNGSVHGINKITGIYELHGVRSVFDIPVFLGAVAIYRRVVRRYRCGRCIQIIIIIIIIIKTARIFEKNI